MKGWETREGRQTGGEQGEEEEGCKVKKKNETRGIGGGVNVIHTHQKKKYYNLYICDPKSELPDRKRKEPEMVRKYAASLLKQHVPIVREHGDTFPVSTGAPKKSSVCCSKSNLITGPADSREPGLQTRRLDYIRGWGG